MPRKFISLIVISFINIVSYNAQFIYVFDYETNTPIEGVLIENSNSTIKIYTNNYGEAKLNSFNKNDLIIFSKNNYTSEYFEISLLSSLCYEVRLKRGKTLQNIVIEPIKSFNNQFYNHKYTVIGENHLKSNITSNTADFLLEKGNITIQKTQAGGGSPILRGFEANRILLVIDNIRMNNAIYRSGHLQNSISIDNRALENIEIISGPNSVIYGSDALGGVIHFKTKNNHFSDTSLTINMINFTTGYNSASNSSSYHINFGANSKVFSSFSAFTYSKYGELKMGKNRNHNFQNWGKYNYYQVFENNKDTLYLNSNTDIQKFTDYRQYDFLQKLNYKINKNNTIIVNIQYSTTSKIFRHDNMTEWKNDKPKFAESFYSPQSRLLTAISIENKTKSKIYDIYNLIISYQKINEGRVKRKYNNNKKISNIENLDLYAINYDFVKLLQANSILYYGLDLIANNLHSTSYSENIYDDYDKKVEISQYPDGKNIYTISSIYLLWKKKLNAKINSEFGFRYSHTISKSNFIDTSLLLLGIKEIKYNIGAPTFSVKFDNKINANANLMLILSSAYRSPNIDDYGKVREKGDNLLLPNDKLKPEYAYNIELVFEKSFTRNKNSFNINFNIFYTFLKNAINQSFMLDNQGNILQYNFQGNILNLLQNKNLVNANVYGYTINMIYNYSNKIIVTANNSYTKGYEINKKFQKTQNLAHIPPIYGNVSVKYKLKKIDFEVRNQFQLWKKHFDYDLYNIDNLSQATEMGNPQWSILNFYTKSYFLKNKITINMGVENIFDIHYKLFASSISQAGRAYVISITYNFYK